MSAQIDVTRLTNTADVPPVRNAAITARLLFGRPLPGSVGEWRRVVHVFEVPAGNVPPERLTALCGTSFGPGELEPLDRPLGMPCESCLLRVAPH